MLLQKCEVFSEEDDLGLLCAQAQEDFNALLNQDSLKEYYKINHNFEGYIEEILSHDYEEKMQILDEKRV